MVRQTKRPLGTKSRTLFKRFEKLQFSDVTQNPCNQPMVDLCFHSICDGKIPQKLTPARI